MNVAGPPLTWRFTLAYVLSLAIALLMTSLSLTGLLFQSTMYPAKELHQSFVSNDLVNLLIGLPILLGSMWLVGRDRLMGLLLWPGALFYVIYNSIAYAIALSFNLMFLPYLVLVVLSAYAIFSLLSNIDSASIQQRLKGMVPERLAGGVLIGFGGLFLVRAVGQIVSALTGQVSFAAPELGVLVADYVITPVWIIGGGMLWRRQAFGYVTGAGLLFQASMLFIGLLVYFILQPILAGVPFPVEDWRFSLWDRFALFPLHCSRAECYRRNEMVNRLKDADTPRRSNILFSPARINVGDPNSSKIRVLFSRTGAGIVPSNPATKYK